MDGLYVYRWDRQGRKGQLCRVRARGTMNSACVAFLDGHTMVTSRNALRRAKPADLEAFEYHPGRDSHDSYFAAVEAKRLRGDRTWSRGGQSPAGPAAVTWRVVSPAPRSAALELAGPSVRIRRLLTAQVAAAQSAAVYRGDELLAIACFAPCGWRRVEMALAIAPAAARHMRRLVRLAQLTLARIAQTRLVVARVDPANRAGRRMATLTGFRPGRSSGLMIFRGDFHVGNPGRRRGAQGGGGEPEGAAGGQ